MNATKIKNGIPEHFSSAEEAGEFWDSHSAADYGDELEEVDIPPRRETGRSET